MLLPVDHPPRLRAMLSALVAAWIALFALRPAPALPQNMADVTHLSSALGVSKTFRVYVPSNPQPGEKFTVLFALHGWSLNYLSWDEATNIEYLADNFRMIIVFPDAGYSSWWMNSAYDPTYQYDAYLIELVQLIDQMYPTYARREGRAIMGFSMGGHGAFRMAVMHPDVFCSASSFAGILKITNHPYDWNIADRLGSLAMNFPSWEANSVYEQCHRFAGADVALMFDCGTSDWTTALYEARITHERLLAAGVDHVWTEVGGTHDWNYVQSRQWYHLVFHDANMRNSLFPTENLAGLVLY